MEKRPYFEGEIITSKFGSWKVMEVFYENDKKYYRLRCEKCGDEFVITPRKASRPSSWCVNCNAIKYQAYLDQGLQQCRKCHQLLPFSAFRERKNCKGGINHTCKVCEVKYTKEPEYLADWEHNTKKCKMCKKVKTPADFSMYPGAADGLMYWCKQCRCEHDRRVRPSKKTREQLAKEREERYEAKLQRELKKKGLL